MRLQEYDEIEQRIIKELDRRYHLIHKDKFLGVVLSVLTAGVVFIGAVGLTVYWTAGTAMADAAVKKDIKTINEAAAKVGERQPLERIAALEQALGGDAKRFREPFYEFLKYCQSVGRYSATAILNPHDDGAKAVLQDERSKLTQAWNGLEPFVTPATQPSSP